VNKGVIEKTEKDILKSKSLPMPSDKNLVEEVKLKDGSVTDKKMFSNVQQKQMSNLKKPNSVGELLPSSMDENSFICIFLVFIFMYRKIIY
jgi:hypothetical protein